ncbi:MAG: Fe-S cluster assembly protein SufD [Solirubrobacterales bacterium]|nr:Fe-S cluster assembly protein SufD [Solirubrobacterales bacterium]MCB8969527.1 Fe-S cluster assembly protein SufD [Thermoleophilales bacterium]MCO5326584.1 Fe-S cluster assembly protein SufD [Solirubrobacterales bacterium]
MDSSVAAVTETSEPSWLAERRAEAVEAAKGLSLPGPKTRGWEFNDLSGLDLSAYEPAEPGDIAVAEAASARLAVPEGSAGLTQVDGAVVSGAGVEVGGNGRPDAPVVMPLSEGVERFGDLVSERLGTIVETGTDPFVAINDAGWSGGALIYVPAGARFEAPISLTVVQQESGRTLNWRTLIVLEEGAEAEVWERYVSADDDIDAMFNGVTELIVGPNASLRYVCGQDLSPKSWAFASQRAEVERDGSLEWVALGFGAARGKVRMETKLAGRGASAKVTGAYAGTGRQHLDYDTTQEHAAEDTFSDLSFRGVLAGRSTAVWRGMINVDEGAQRTDAFQDCRNLLLSSKAHADAIPGLQIEADDVACTHAAAVAQVDPEQLFYLTSRGLDNGIAKSLIIEGFLAELVERVPGGAVADALSEALSGRLEELLAS